MPDVVLTVNGHKYGGWKDVQVTRGIEAVAGSFSMSVSERWGGQDAPWPINEGDECQVAIDGTNVITGFVDKRGHSYGAGEHTLSVSGRDKTADLVDCSAVLANWEFRNLPVLTVAQRVAAPYGVAVALQAGLSLPTPPQVVTVNPGDTAFDVIERACRLVAALPVADGAGGLLLTRAGSGRAATDLVEGQNILEAVAEYDSTNRYRRYVVAGQHPGADEFFGAATAHVLAEATDQNARAVRQLWINPGVNVTPAYAKQRAEWEATVRAARAGRVQVTVQGWQQAGGVLWPINALVRVVSPFLGLDTDMLISQAAYTLSEQGGTRTVLSLARPDAFVPEPVVPFDPWKIADGSD